MAGAVDSQHIGREGSNNVPEAYSRRG